MLNTDNKNNFKFVLGIVVGILVGGITVVGVNKVMQSSNNIQTNSNEIVKEVTDEIPEDYTFNNSTNENMSESYENSQKVDTTLQYSPVGSEHQIWLVNKFSEVTKGDIINSINEISIKDNNYYIVNAGLDDNGYTLLFDSNGNEVKDTINKLIFREFLNDEIISFGDKEITLKSDRFEDYNICVLDSGYILCIPINEGNSLTQMEILNSNLETIYISGIDKLYDLFYINDGILIFSNNVQQYDSKMQLDTYIKVTYKLDLASLKTAIIETSTKIRGPAGQS